jgi:hypothetical protein
VRGYSWTASLERATWFARRFSYLEDPTVYRVTAPEAAVLAYVNAEKGRDEQEFLVLLPPTVRPMRVQSRDLTCHTQG